MSRSHNCCLHKKIPALSQTCFLYAQTQPTLLVVVLHSDDLSPCCSGTGQNSSSIQGLDGEWVNHTDVLSYKNA